MRKFSIGAVFISGNDNSNPRLIRFDTTLISSVKGANNKIKVIKNVQPTDSVTLNYFVYAVKGHRKLS